MSAGRGKDVTVTRFSLTLPILDSEVLKQWNDKQVKFTVVKEDNAWINALVGALPWILLIVVWLIIMRRMQGGAGDPGDILVREEPREDAHRGVVEGDVP